ncbi:MAG: VTT domain-containing protein [Pseudomonadota bacterium]
MFKRIGRFVTSMDAQAASSVLVSLALLGFIALMYFYGASLFGLDGADDVEAMIAEMAGAPWAVLAVTSAYVILALTGFPQFLLIGATTLSFGPFLGAAYAWIATMVSATVTFFLGRLFGAGLLARFSGPRVLEFTRVLERRGVLASALVRVVPSAPFIVVNMAGGVSPMPLWKFWLGTGVGVTPKIAMVAVFGVSLFEFFLKRNPRDLIAIAAVVAGWIVFLYVARRLYLRLRERTYDLD